MRASAMHAFARRPSGVTALVLATAGAAGLILVATSGATADAIADDPAGVAAFILLALALQSVSVDVYGRGSISVSGIGLLATGFAFGVGPAVLCSVLTAVVHAARRRPQVHKTVFNASTFALATAAGVAMFHLADQHSSVSLGSLPASLAGSVAFTIVNLGLLTLVMSVAEGDPVGLVWRERFHWLTPHYIAFGPLALGAVAAYDRMGTLGLAALALPPAMMTFSIHQYLNRTRQAVEEVREANARLLQANDDLEERNKDLAQLLTLSQTLTAKAHDRDDLVETSERALAGLFRTPVRIRVSPGAPGEPLVVGGTVVGAVDVATTPDFDAARWERLSDILLPHLATALESATLVDEVRRRHLATIAALSKSMEAKDGYTGGHVERVSGVAVALARRLGYEGEELDAVEVGALLHDIGKIGIPEAIIRKPGPLNDDEWAIMKEHPLISEHILAECDLPPIVLQVARSSHERWDGDGYPDGLAAEEIPMPARIVLVADALDALTSDRSYRRGRTVDEAMDEIRRHAGTQFCPAVVDALEDVYRRERAVLGAAKAADAVDMRVA